MSQHDHDVSLTTLENALAGLAPLPAALDRDRVMFRAGQASIRRGWAWPAATAILGLVAAGLGGVLALWRAPAPMERVVYVKVKVPVPQPPSPRRAPAALRTVGSAAPETVEPSPSRNGYLQLQYQVLRWGLDGLPSLPPARGPEPPALREPRLPPAVGDSPDTLLFLLNLFHGGGDAP
jgi:hypothetical protein